MGTITLIVACSIMVTCVSIGLFGLLSIIHKIK